MVEVVQRETSRRRQYLQWYHGIANISYVLILHAALIGWLWYGRLVVPYTAFVVLSVLACVIHQRILSEWFHEATHWNIVADRIWSDWLSDLLIGPFNGTRVMSNRPNHFRHHAATVFFTPDDPDTDKAAAATRAELFRGVLIDLSGRTAIEAFLSATGAGTEDGGRVRFGKVLWFLWLGAIHAAGLYVTIAAGYYEIYPIYFFSLLALYPVANRFRLYVQHAWIREDGTIYLNESGASRTYFGGLFTQLFLISPMIMYHYEHHAWPSLPYRALRATTKRSRDPNVFGIHPFRLLGKVLVGL
jgi:fatty acid desaturase